MAIEKRLITDRPTWLRWRLVNVNGSEAPCLFADDLHPYMSAFQLWAEKSGLDPGAGIDSPVLRRGRSLEHIVLEMAAEDTGWTILPGDSYYFDPVARIGATPDAFALRPDREGAGNLQAKTADIHGWRKHWVNKSTGEVEIPLWVAIQASIEAYLTGLAWAVVAVLNMAEWKVYVLDVPLVPELIDKLRELVDDFWQRVKSGDFYPPRWEHDADLIRRMFAVAEDREIDLSGDNEILPLLKQREELKELESRGNKAEAARKLLEAELILTKLENAERALLPDGRILHAPTRHRKAYPVAASQWRQISIKEAK